MSTTTETEQTRDGYALGRGQREYERLRSQARVWESATGRLLDQVALASGARCLDAGSGPGETMRLMAERVGAAGHVLGADIDETLGRQAVAMLHGLGHSQCEFVAVDLTDDAPLPGAPFDLVYARLLLFHLPERVAGLRRLWENVAAGGFLLVQDYDLRGINVTPPLPSLDELGRVIMDAFTASGCDIQTGARLPELFAQAGIGPPDDTDVAGRLELLADIQTMLTTVYRSILPAAIRHGVTTESHAASVLADFENDVKRFPERPTLWPLLIGAWKRKGIGTEGIR
jgi:SAM-dependent methyltransferase